MKAILPGKPEASLQALTTGYWNPGGGYGGGKGNRIVVYMSGNALAILCDDALIQTIYDNDERKLEAVAFDEFSGKIAACTGSIIRVYKPYGEGDDLLKWVLQSSFQVDDAPTPATLSWGASEELLVGRTSLWLYNTSLAQPSCHWQTELATPARTAVISYDSAYIASVGHHDRLVKVWRRLNFGSEEVHFDFAYLAHPRSVTSMEWRKPPHVDQTMENVLYTFCADNAMRVWVGADGHTCDSLRLWGKLDLATAVQDRKIKSTLRWAFIISQRDLVTATEKAVQEKGAGKEDVALQYLVSIANRDTEICIVLDGQGNMAAYALENVSSKSQSTNKIDNVALAKSKDFDFTSVSGVALPHVEIANYCSNSSGYLHLLLHYFDGRIEVFQSSIADLLNPTYKPGGLTHRATWSGHSTSIKKIVRNFSGRAIVSRSEQGESLVWKHALHSKETKLLRQNVIPEKRHIHRICLLRGGRFVVFLHHDAVCLWDCRQSTPSLLAEKKYTVKGKPLCILTLPRQTVEEVSIAHIATITSEQRGIVWEFHLPMTAGSQQKPQVNGHNGIEPSIREFCTFGLEGAEDLAYVLPVDPAGASPIISGFLDVFARDVAVSYTHSGRVEFWTARVDRDRGRVEWLSTSSMETGVENPALVSGSTMKKAALVNANRSAFTIWDIRGARLEYIRDFDDCNTIQDLDWTSTPDSQSILAVGFQYRVVLLSQMRFDYLNKGPAWAQIREISIRDFTPHPIGDSTWLSGGSLVIGAGNQLFMYDRIFETPTSLVTNSRLPHHKDGSRDLFEVVQRLNGPLPVFHPQFLSQCMVSGKHSLVKQILLALHHALKYHVEGDPIDDYLGIDLAQFYLGSRASAGTNGMDPSYLVRRMSIDDGDDAFTEDTALSICERLQRIAIPQLSGHEQIQLLDIVECVGVVEKQRRSLDENGARFMLFFRQHALRKGRTNEIHMSWRETNWAFHSTSQDILTDFVSRQYHGRMVWENARESGIFMWLADAAAVKAQFEVVARNEYTKSEMKNPVDCSLFYLALRKKTVLQGLWRMATWNKEQAATQRLLANNFDEPKWQTTALKNAYALLSKRRFEYAVAFFLLADRLQDAVNVCLNQIKDLQLGIAIARVYEGDSGPVLRKLLENEVLSIAAQEGNRWLASWAFWMLKRRDMAVRALITPVYTVLETPAASTDLKAKSFLTDDPALIVLYSQLRQMTLQTLRGASKVTGKTEWEFVLHNARLYDRMGCDLLGLDLVRNWEFLRDVKEQPGLGGDIDPRKLLRRRSSLVVADMPLMPVEGNTGFGAMGDKEKAAPTVFEEPDAGSLLDSFGF